MVEFDRFGIGEMEQLNNRRNKINVNSANPKFAVVTRYTISEVSNLFPNSTLNLNASLPL